MRVFVYEHLCAGGAAAPSLRIEGQAMLAALLEDFRRLPAIAVDTLLADGVAPPAGVAVHRPGVGGAAGGLARRYDRAAPCPRACGERRLPDRAGPAGRPARGRTTPVRRRSLSLSGRRPAAAAGPGRAGGPAGGGGGGRGRGLVRLG